MQRAGVSESVFIGTGWLRMRQEYRLFWHCADEHTLTTGCCRWPAINADDLFNGAIGAYISAVSIGSRPCSMPRAQTSFCRALGTLPPMWRVPRRHLVRGVATLPIPVCAAPAHKRSISRQLNTSSLRQQRRRARFTPHDNKRQSGTSLAGVRSSTQPSQSAGWQKSTVAPARALGTNCLHPHAR